MAGVRVGVHPAVFRLHRVDRFLDGAAHHDAAQRQVAGGHALGERADVGLDVPVAGGEPLARPAEAGDHLVGDEQHLVPVADLAHEREVVVGRIEHAAAAVDRLGDERRDRVGAFADDRFFQQARGGLARGLARLATLLAVRIAGRDVHEAGHARLEHLPVGGHAGGAHRLQRHAVVGVLARDDLHLVRLALGLPVEARRLERRLVGLGAAGREEDALHVAGELDQLGGQRDGRDAGGADVAREVGELLHLGRRGVGQLGAAVTDVDVPQAREPVDHLVAADVLDHRAAAADVDDRLGVVDRMVERMDQVILVGLDQLGGGHRHRTILPGEDIIEAGRPAGARGGSRHRESPELPRGARGIGRATPMRDDHRSSVTIARRRSKLYPSSRSRTGRSSASSSR